MKFTQNCSNFIKIILIDLMKKFFKKKHEKQGTIEFTAGEFEIFVHADMCDADEVDFKIETCDHSTCGYLDPDKFFIEERNDGFILKAIVESNEVKFHWVIK